MESPRLRESAALKALLRHVVEETLAGRQSGLKEYALGLSVFHRRADYDPRNDAIVRVQASQLRKKLAAYYENEGRESEIRIDLPRGGYVAQFLQGRQDVAPVAAVEPKAEVAAAPAEVPQVTKVAGIITERWRFAWGAFAIGLLAALAALAMVRWPEPPRMQSTAGTSVWRGFLEPKRPAVVSLGVPLFFVSGGALFVRDVQVNRGENPSETMKKMEAALGTRFKVHEDVYTGVGEALGVARVSQWLDRLGAEVLVANSHFLGESDLKDRNLVVISSMRFQTLLDPMKLPVAFEFEPAGSGAIVNLLPLRGEQARYVSRTGSGVDISYGLLTVYPGATAGTRILYLSGMHSWTTNGTAQFAVSASHLADLDRRLSADPDDGSRGRKSPYFQALLQVEGKHDQVRHIEYVTHRYLKVE